MIKYASLWLKLKRQHPGYEVSQYNIIIDVLGRYSQKASERVINLLGPFEEDAESSAFVYLELEDDFNVNFERHKDFII